MTYEIVLSGTFGNEIDKRIVSRVEDTKAAVIAILEAIPYLEDGDKITVVAIED